MHFFTIFIREEDLIEAEGTEEIKEKSKKKKNSLKNKYT